MLIFRGSLRRLNYGYYEPGLKAMVAKGMEEYLWQNKILFKDYQDHVKQISERLKKASLEPPEKQNIPVVFQRDPSVDKNLTAREIASEKGITSGPICVISTLKPSPAFEHRGKHITRRTRPSHVLYQYQIHPETGWMLTSSAEERRPYHRVSNTSRKGKGKDGARDSVDYKENRHRRLLSPVFPDFVGSRRHSAGA